MPRTRLIFMLPTARRAAVNTALSVAGFGPDTFSIPIIQGASPITTHYACDGAFTAKQIAEITRHPGVTRHDEGPLSVPGRLASMLAREGARLNRQPPRSN